MPPTDPGIASILHRETLATIVGGKMFQRGLECFSEKRVLGVDSAQGELCGIVKPQEAGRAPYEIRIWVRDDGLAYECTCPIGVTQKFCKHTVAVALAHLEKEEQERVRRIDQLRDRLLDVPLRALLDGLVHHAKREPAVLSALLQLTAVQESP